MVNWKLMMIQNNLTKLNHKNFFFFLFVLLGSIVILLYFNPITDKPNSYNSDKLVNYSSIQSGLDYLTNQYNLEIGLLRESPNVSKNKYWLTNDNTLVAFTFLELGEIKESLNLTNFITQYDSKENGIIEVLWQKRIRIPPHASQIVLIKKIGENEIWQEKHFDGPIMEDYLDYANLGFLTALNHYYQGDQAMALNTYQYTLQIYDGIGFKDKAFNGTYETYKIALALYVGSIIDAPNDEIETMLKTLLTLQNTNGGFFTHYTPTKEPIGDTNTETTAYAILALMRSVDSQ